MTALNEQENFILADNFDVDKFGRAIAKIANGVIAGECGLESFEPFLADYILGKAPEQGAVLIGKWPEDGKPRPAGILHQVGRAFRNFKGRDYVAVRLRLFAELQNTPIYQIVVGPLIKSIDDVLAPLGMRAVRTND